MQIRFHPEARIDFRNGADYYAAVRLELAQEFYRHIDQVVAEICSNPTLYRIFRRPSARRHHRRGFPYAVVYVLKPDHIWIVAVMHFKQRPNYWLHRLEN